MADLIFSVNAVIPIFVVMFLGFLLRLRNFVDESFVEGSTKVMFNIAIPCMLAYSIINTGFAHAFNPTLIIIGILGTLAIICVLWLTVPRFIKSPATYTAFIQSCFRGNYVLLGFPLAGSIAGPAAISQTAALMSIMVPFYNIMAVIILAQSNRDAHQLPLHSVLKRIITNPLIIGVAVGTAISLLEIRLPILIYHPLSLLSQMAAPLALFTLGSSINLKTDLSRLRPALVISAIRLIAFPVVFLAVGYALGLRDVELTVLLVLSCAPVAIVCFPMAYQMGADHQLASMSIIVSTFLSVATILFFVYITRVLGWIAIY